MKNLIITVFLIATCSSLLLGQVEYGVKVGGGISELLGEHEDTKELGGHLYNPTFAYHAGFFAELQFFNYLFFSVDPAFTAFGAHHEYYKPTYNDDPPTLVTYEDPIERLYFVNIPTSVRSNFLFPKWLSIGAGINNAFYLEGISDGIRPYLIETYHLDFYAVVSFSYKKYMLEIEYFKGLDSLTEKRPYDAHEYFNRAFMFSLKYTIFGD